MRKVVRNAVFVTKTIKKKITEIVAQPSFLLIIISTDTIQIYHNYTLS